MREITRSVKVAVKCLIAVVFVDVNLPYWTSKVEHSVSFAAIVCKILQRMRRNGYFGTSGKFRRFGDVYHYFFCILHAECHSIPRPRFFLQSVRNFGDLETFCIDFCISWAEYFLYFYFRLILPTAPSLKILIFATHCRVIASCCWCVAWPCDLDFWPGDLDELSYMAGHVINTPKKLEYPIHVRSWVISYSVFHWLGLLFKMRFWLLRMRRIA